MDDATFCGRQTKRMFQNRMLFPMVLSILIVSAVVLLWLGLYARGTFHVNSQWEHFPSDENTIAVPCGNKVLSTCGPYLIASDRWGALQWIPFDCGQGSVLVGGTVAAAYIPGNQELTVCDGKHFYDVSVPVGILDVSISPKGMLAVITGASGAYTETVIMDRDGTEKAYIREADYAMVQTVFSEEETLFALLLSPGGDWALATYDLNGHRQSLIQLDCVYVYDFCVSNGHIMVLTDRYLYFAASGAVLHKEYIGHRSIQYLFPMEYGFACVVQNTGMEELYIYDHDGILVNLIQLPAHVRGGTVVDDSLFLLTSEGCSVYRPDGKPIYNYQQGARAESICSTNSGCYFFGIGERYFVSS